MSTTPAARSASPPSLLSPEQARGLCRRGARRIRQDFRGAFPRPGRQEAAVAGGRPRQRGARSTWPTAPPTKPTFLGTRSFDDYDLAELADYIDWTPFFQTWELTGRFPAILDDPKVGEAARSLYDDARKMLDRIVKEKWFKAQRHHRLLAGQRASATTSWSTPTRAATTQIATLHTLRQQLEKREGRFNAALSDFIAPQQPACRIISAASSSPPASART